MPGLYFTHGCQDLPFLPRYLHLLGPQLQPSRQHDSSSGTAGGRQMKLETLLLTGYEREQLPAVTGTRPVTLAQSPSHGWPVPWLARKLHATPVTIMLQNQVTGHHNWIQLVPIPCIVHSIPQKSMSWRRSKRDGCK